MSSLVSAGPTHYTSSQMLIPVPNRKIILLSAYLIGGGFLAFSAAAAFVPAFLPALPAANAVFLLAGLVINKLVHDDSKLNEELRVERLHRGQRELHDALERAESSERTRRSIIANMSHEFRTPLNTVIGFAELLAEGETDGERKEMARCVQRGGWDLLTLVNGLVKAAELSGGGYSDRSDRFSLPELLASVEAARGPEARAKGLEMTTECTGAREFLGDLESLCSILGILVGNAVKYSERGTISVSARELEVADSGRALVEYRVSDSGLGMDEKTVSRLFAPFEQGDDPLIKRYPGVGIGLYTAKRLAEALRGDLRLESELGVGTTAYLIVPLEIDSIQGERTNV